MAIYDVIQLTESQYYLHPSISDDGSRVVYSAMTSPADMPTIWLFDRDHDDEPRQLSVFARGDDHNLVSYYPQISGNGQEIVFTNKGYYTEEEKSGLYVYDIDSSTARLKAENRIPRYPSGAERPGEPGLQKRVCSKPSISGDGQMLSYILKDYRYSGAHRDCWQLFRESLTIAEGGDSSRGDGVLEINTQSHFGNGILSQQISGDGRFIALYAGGVVEGLEVNNLEMPLYEAVTHGETSAPTCNVYCYIVRIERPGHYRLEVVPSSDSLRQPLVVAHPQSSNIQSFDINNLLYANPPSICSNGSRIALNAGLVMRAENTGNYVCEPYGTTPAPNIHMIITFGTQPGISPGEETLTTGVVPAISCDGRWLAFNRREVSFPEGYGDTSTYEGDETHCPNVEKDVVEVRRLPGTDISDLIETIDDSNCPFREQNMRLGIARDASHITFVSRANKLYYATLVAE